MDRALQQQLEHVYEDFEIPADRIVTDPRFAERFSDRVRSPRGDRDWPTADIMRVLLAMRKAGQLPRLRRPAR